MTVATHEGPPDAVRIANAHFYGGEHYIGRRLLDDPNMGQVWRTLMSEGNDHNPQSLEGRLDSLDGLYRMETWGAPTYGVSLADQACASFFLATSIVFGVGNHVVTESSIQKELTRWRDGAALCREALVSPHGACVDPALAQALETSAACFEKWAGSIERSAASSPYLIGRGARKKGVLRRNDNIRGQVCDLARITHKVFGSFLHVPIATAAMQGEHVLAPGMSRINQGSERRDGCNEPSRASLVALSTRVHLPQPHARAASAYLCAYRKLTLNVQRKSLRRSLFGREA